MTLEIGFLFALLAAMVYLFLTEKLPVDLTAFLGLIILIFGGYLEADEAFTGFASPAVITMLSVFIVGAALLETGVADVVGSRIHKWVGSGEIPLIITLMLVAGILSAFMNNIAATAVLMPAVAAIARRAGVPPSRLFIPLSFGAILGGTTTLVGTPPNILAAQLLSERGLEPFTLFDFTPMGLAMLGMGVVFMITIGRKLLPTYEPHDAPGTSAKDLARVYQLESRLFSIRLPKDSEMDGLTLGSSRLGSTLGVKVVAIERDGRRQLAPGADDVVRGGDLLLVEGEASRLEELLSMQGIELESTRFAELPSLLAGVGGVRARIPEGSSLVSKTLRDLRFRERFGVVVVAIQRQGEMLRDRLGEVPLEVEDRVLALGTRQQIEELSTDDDFEVREVGMSAIERLQNDLHVIHIPASSKLVGSSISESRLGELAGLTVGGLIRGGETRLAISPLEVIEAEDQLLVAANPASVNMLLELGDVEVDLETPEVPLESAEVGVVEAALAPRASVAGKTLAQLDFTDRYGLIALSLWRGGQPLHKDLAHVEMKIGDALLLQGSHKKIKRLAGDPDWVVLSDKETAPRRLHKAPFAFAGLLLMVGLVVAGIQPIHVAAFTAASLVILSGALTMQESYRAIEWKAIFLVAAVLPVGLAMERSGAALLMAEKVTELAGPLGPHAILAALIVLSSLLSQGLDGAPAIVLLTPVVMQTAENLSISPYPLMMGAGLAASAAFMTPFSHKANLLVMGAGGYKSADYLKVGTPLTLAIFVLLTIMVPIFFPF